MRDIILITNRDYGLDAFELGMKKLLQVPMIRDKKSISLDLKNIDNIFREFVQIESAQEIKDIYDSKELEEIDKVIHFLHFFCSL
jgi:hypothetical protein